MLASVYEIIYGGTRAVNSQERVYMLYRRWRLQVDGVIFDSKGSEGRRYDVGVSAVLAPGSGRRKLYYSDTRQSASCIATLAFPIRRMIFQLIILSSGIVS